MPNLRLLFIVKLTLFLFFIQQSTQAQSNKQKLDSGDSLFKAKQYKEAMKLYESILLEGEAYSPAMLLKMGFISEGIGDFGKASLFLSNYYDHNPNPRVIDKIKSLTNQNNLVGYNISDKERFFKILIDLKLEITILFTLLMIIFLILVFLFPAKRTVFYIPATICLFVAFLANNFLSPPETAIITGSPVLIMDQPTSAGNLIRRVDAGHRIIIQSSRDIWYEIKWGDQKAYVRKEDISKI
ncbi:MAG: SH3 domain-containing protein [Cyclobacteriaceae bacterium]